MRAPPLVKAILAPKPSVECRNIRRALIFIRELERRVMSAELMTQKGTHPSLVYVNAMQPILSTTSAGVCGGLDRPTIDDYVGEDFVSEESPHDGAS